MNQIEIQAVAKSKEQFESILKTLYDNKMNARLNKNSCREDASKENAIYFYDGEVNAYCVCIELLEKLLRSKEDNNAKDKRQKKGNSYNK